MEEIKISVITVCYNAADTLEKTIQSVLGQTYRNIEYIIIDGGSTDGTVEIIHRYANRLAYWVSEPDEGIYDAMNKGILVSRGKYIYFLGADDTLCENVLLEIAPLLTHTHTIYYGDVYMINQKRSYDGLFSCYKLAIHNICHQAIFYSHSIYEERLYDVNYRLFADYVFNIQSWGDKRIKFVYLPFIVANFNDCGRSSNKKNDSLFLKKNSMLVLQNLGFICFMYYQFVHLYLKLKSFFSRNV